MESIEYENMRNEIRGIAERAFLLERYGFMEEPVEDFRRVFGEIIAKTPLCVAVCGQYSSGKSTMVAFLTGRKTIRAGEEDPTGGNAIRVGEGVTTEQPVEYEWKGVGTIVDTPGIFSDRPEHDKISHERMAQADLLLYMIHSEGFSPEVEKDFKETICARYAEQTMLVMNQIGKVDEENLPAKRQDAAEVLGDEELLEKHAFCMVDVEDYIRGEEEHDDELKAVSRMDGFREKLDGFLKQRKLYGKCLAPLNVVDEFIGLATSVCESKEARGDFARRQKDAIENAMRQYRKAFRNAKMRLLGKIEEERLDLLGLFREHDGAFEEKWKGLADRIAASADDAGFQDDLAAIGDTLSAELADIGDQAAGLDEYLRGVASRMPEGGGGVAFDVNKWKTGVGQLGHLLEGVNKDALLQVVHWFGGKFKPWGAVKWVKGLNALGRAVPLVAQALGRAADAAAKSKEDEACRELEGVFDGIEEKIREFYDGVESTEPYQRLLAEKNAFDEAEAIRKRTNAEKDAVLDELRVLKGQTAACRTRLAGS